MITPPDLSGLTIVQQAGSGRAATHGGDYPLRALRPIHSVSGRGIVSLEAGAGSFDLSGSEADVLGPGRWRLHIDRTAILSVSPAQGECDLRMRASPPTYVSLSCRVLIGGDPRPVTVDWRGDGSPAVRVR